MASIEDLKLKACDAIDKHASELFTLSRAIWNDPELSFEEIHAHSILTDFLEKHGLKMERHHVLKTAFRGTKEAGSGKGPHVGLICEYDALPDIGHACGHNMIAEVGAGAAVGVMAAIQSQSAILNGKLTVIGTPAEEYGGGKVDLLEKGCFQGLDAAMMAHPWSFSALSPPGVLADHVVEVTYHGKASHAAGFPWEGINALDAAVMAYNNISCLRQQIKPNWRVHGIIKNGGAKPNIIPEEASLEFEIRTPSLAELPVLREKVKCCFEAAAKATGCKVEMVWDPRVLKNMLTNKTLASLYQANATSLGVETDGDPQKVATLAASTDMGNVSHAVPSIHPWFHVGSNAANHTREFTDVIGDVKVQPYALQQAKALAMTALDVLTQPQLTAQIHSHFQEDLRRDQAL